MIGDNEFDQERRAAIGMALSEFFLQEGSTLWLGSGATLIRAKTNQCRECTTREQLQASLNGVAVLQQPVTLETLLKTFTGRHFQNIAGEAPSQKQMADDLSATDVRVAPDLQRQPPDERRVRRMSDPTGQAASKGKIKGQDPAEEQACA